MIIFKTLEPEEILTTLLHVFAEVLPEEIKSANGKLSASFNDDNSVDIYLIMNDGTENPNN